MVSECRGHVLLPLDGICLSKRRKTTYGWIFANAVGVCIDLEIHQSIEPLMN